MSTSHLHEKTVQQAFAFTTSATRMPQNCSAAGTPVKTVSKRLGHANAKITMDIYAHLSSGDDERKEFGPEIWTRSETDKYFVFCL